MKKILILKYGDAGNIGSIVNSLKKNIPDKRYKIKISTNRKDILMASALVLPGVGNNKNIMEMLKKYSLDKEIIKFYRSERPILAICAGLQILYDFSEEGNVKCLGILKGEVLRIKESKTYKVPSYGWHKTEAKKKVKYINKFDYFYYLHSYYVKTKSNVVMYYKYAYKHVPSLVIKKKLIGAQFHPELSSEAGDKIIQFFLKKI